MESKWNHYLSAFSHWKCSLVAGSWVCTALVGLGRQEGEKGQFLLIGNRPSAVFRESGACVYHVVCNQNALSAFLSILCCFLLLGIVFYLPPKPNHLSHTHPKAKATLHRPFSDEYLRQGFRKYLHSSNAAFQLFNKVNRVFALCIYLCTPNSCIFSCDTESVKFPRPPIDTHTIGGVTFRHFFKTQ